MNQQENNGHPGAGDPEMENISNSEEVPEAGTEEEGGWKPNVSRNKLILGIFVIFAGVLIALFAWGLTPFNSGNQTTNNAYVRGMTTVISPQVSGYLTEVPVKDFQRVKKGQLLARIDPAPYRQRLQQGRANTAAQAANLANSQQSLRSGQAQMRLQDASVAAAQAGLQKAQADMRRIEELVGEGSVSLRERDQARAALKQAEAGVLQAKAQRAIAAEQVRSVQVGRSALEAQVQGADASVELAEIELSRTNIRAPRDGRLSKFPSPRPVGNRRHPADVSRPRRSLGHGQFQGNPDRQNGGRPAGHIDGRCARRSGTHRHGAKHRARRGQRVQPRQAGHRCRQFRQGPATHCSAHKVRC